MTYLDISFYLFFFKHITTTSIDPLSLHDALPILNSAVTGELMSSPVIGMPRSPDSRVAMSMGIWPSNGTRRRFASRARSEERRVGKEGRSWGWRERGEKEICREMGGERRHV